MTEVQRRLCARAAWPPWSAFVATLVSGVLALGLLSASFILAVDPYGTRANPERGQSPIMDNDQRHMYPQIARSGRYDGVVFGTSTVRLLEPTKLAELFGGKFANLGLNGGTPWEQVQMVDLFLRHTRSPKTLIWGIDAAWCEADADRRRTTQFVFPAWLYDEDALNDVSGHLNLRTLQTAGRVTLNRAGLMKERIRSDGYERFLPPDSAYDLARARRHIDEMRHPSWGGAASSRKTPAATEETPALNWLDDVLSRVPDTTTKILLFPPAHATTQPAPGTLDSRLEAQCKARVAAIGERRRAMVLDFRLSSSVTRDDSNYWDSLHYRVAVADRVAVSLRDALRDGRPSPDGFFEILSTGR
jgi:hypothetical protein